MDRMTPERLALIRGWIEDHRRFAQAFIPTRESAEAFDVVAPLLAELDAVTRERDEARSMVTARRMERDAIAADKARLDWLDGETRYYAALVVGRPDMTVRGAIDAAMRAGNEEERAEKAERERDEAIRAIEGWKNAAAMWEKLSSLLKRGEKRA